MNRTNRVPVSFRFVLYLALILLLVTAASARDKISVSYAKGFNFSQYKTYAWAEHGAVAHPLLAADIVGAIDQELQARGLQKVTSNPDLIIQIYGSLDTDMTMYSNDPLYAGSGGIPPFDPGMTGPAFVGFYGNTSVTVHKGEMIVDLIDAKSKKLVWRGVATESVSSHDAEKLIDEVNGAISKMFKEYPKGA
ncbi:MAG: DUF4136 domain-containing protein [Candidatus Korobacteraceae bacterium]